MATTTDSTIKYIEKLDKLEGDLLKLKKKSMERFPSVPISLKGVWKGIRISEKDTTKAKRNLFKGTK